MFYRATYEDGSVVEQPTNVPIDYNNIDVENLKFFTLMDNSTTVGIDVVEGVIFLNNKKISFEEFSNKGNYRLIYFVKGTEKSPIYYLGIQSTIKGKNLKRIVKIGEQGIKLVI